MHAGTGRGLAETGDSSKSRSTTTCLSTPRTPVLSTGSSAFRSYNQALIAQGLGIGRIVGDGNCLFRSVATQVYAEYLDRSKVLTEGAAAGLFPLSKMKVAELRKLLGDRGKNDAGLKDALLRRLLALSKEAPPPLDAAADVARL